MFKYQRHYFLRGSSSIPSLSKRHFLFSKYLSIYFVVGYVLTPGGERWRPIATGKPHTATSRGAGRVRLRPIGMAKRRIAMSKAALSALRRPIVTARRHFVMRRDASKVLANKASGNLFLYTLDFHAAAVGSQRHRQLFKSQKVG